MSKKMRSRIRIALPVLGFCLLAGAVWTMLPQGVVAGPKGDTGILEKMVAADGSVTLDLDLKRLNGTRSRSRNNTLRFDVSSDTFFTSLAFNDEFRGTLPGTLSLVAKNWIALPGKLSASQGSLVVETLPWGGQYEMVVRDSKSGYVFFNVEGHESVYVASEHKLNIRGGRLLLSDEFAAELGRGVDSKTVVGTINIETTQRPIEVAHIVEGETQSTSLPPTNDPQAGTVPGPDVVVGDLVGLAQFGSSSGTQVGLAVGTDSCNFGTIDLNWFANPNNDHPVIPQNLYRMSANGDRFEQIGQSQVKHAFTALTQNLCGLGCNGVGGTRLGSGCSDPYSASLNAGPSLGSKAWINPFTGFYPRNDSATPNNNHTGHTHTGTSHRILTEIADLNTTLNPGATYYAEAQYVTPHEYAHCQANPTQCNMYNNVSYRRYNVTGTGSPFSFSAAAATVRMKAAVEAWTGATIVPFQPAPGVDGVAMVAYKVTNPSAGVWHYEYAVYNQNLDRAIQSFRIPIGNGVTLSNIGFRMPPQHPGWAADGTFNNLGFSSTPWAQTQTATDITWSSETVAQNQNANAIRWGSMYNFRFDSDRPPTTANATVGFFKTGSPTTVPVQVPTAAQVKTPFDYEGDGKADVSVFRPSSGGWFISQSSNNAFFGVTFGQNGDVIAPGDFDGDNKTDISVFRNGSWFRLNSSNGAFAAVTFGTTGDLPVPGDFDGDGKADVSVYRPSAGSWYRLNSSNGGFVAVGFGIAEDKPQMADFDGDGKADITVFRPSNGTWYWLNSSNGAFGAVNFGISTDLTVPADFDGDGKTDISVYRPSAGSWYRLNSSNGSFAGVAFGISTDRPAAADYDGDGKADIGVFRPSEGTWYLLRSTSGFTAQTFGTNGDVPTPNAFVR